MAGGAVTRSVLYHAWDLAAPSQLWMRRMLEYVAAEAAGVADFRPLPPEFAGRFRYFPVLDQSLPRRVSLRLTRGRTEAWRALQRPSRRRLRTALAAANCALVHYLNVALLCPEPLVKAADAGRPIFVHCHGVDVTWDGRQSDGRPTHADDYLARALDLSRHVTLIANSDFTRGRLVAAGFDAARIVTKPLGVEVPPRPPCRRRGGGPLELLYLGRLVDFKGPDLTLRAFEIACDRGLDGRLTFAGDGPMRTDLERLRNASPHRDRVRLLGATDAATGERLRRDADLFVAHHRLGPDTNQEEAFGVSYVEAMADALPVVSAKSGALPETVGPAGGVLVEPGDVEAQAASFVGLANDPERRAALGAAGHARAAAYYTTDLERRRLRDLLGLEQPT